MGAADRTLAGAGSALVLAALAVIWTARAGVPRDLYVSELGADGEPTAAAFEAALLLIVAGGLAIAIAARRIRSRPPVLRAWPPAATIAASSALFLLASQVPCTAGCPVPYGPLFNWQDFTHTTAAVVAFAAASWAMLQCAFAVGRRGIRRLSLVASLGVAAFAGAGGLMSLFGWHARVGSWFEFVATTIGLLWVAVLGVALAFSRDAVPAGPSATEGDQELVGERA